MALCVLMGGVSVTRNVSAEVYPLHAVEVQILQNLGIDGGEASSLSGSTPFLPVEIRHDLFRNNVEKLGGVFLGVGGVENYGMIAWARSDLAILMNLNEETTALHEAFRVCFLNAGTPQTFINLWSGDSEQVLTQLIRDELGSSGKLKVVLAAVDKKRSKVYKKLQELTLRDQWIKVPSFLTDQADYIYLVSLAKANRIVTVRGRLEGRVTLRELAEVMKRYHRLVRVIYLAEQEQSLVSPRSFYANLFKLPSDGRSVVLRTRSWKVKLPGGVLGPIQHAYSIQALSNLQVWVQREAGDESLKALIRKGKNDQLMVFTGLP